MSSTIKSLLLFGDRQIIAGSGGDVKLATKKSEDPKAGLYRFYRKAKFPTKLGPVSRKPTRGLRPGRDDFVLRRRGIRLPQDDKARQERRAVPLAKVYGTLTERIVYREFQRRRLDFDFQSSLLGGRQQL